MSKLRSINTSIWADTWFEGLEPEEKLLFIYLITNDKTNMLGVYETSLRKVSFETGISLKNIEKYIEKFEKEGKVRYTSNRVILLKFLKHQNYNLNMKKSAVRCYNELPVELKSVGIRVLEESEEGFETLVKGFGMVRKIETETKTETKFEVQSEFEDLGEISEDEIPSQSTKPKVKTIEERKTEFGNKLAQFKSEYSNDMLLAFYNYWTEHGENDKKMRFEKENTFGISQRLVTWNRNNFGNKSNYNNNHGTEQRIKSGGVTFSQSEADDLQRRARKLLGLDANDDTTNF